MKLTSNRSIKIIIIIFIAVITLALVYFLIGMQILGSSVCGDEILQQQNSPTGSHELIYFIRDCGATTDFVTQIKVVSQNKEKTILTINGSHKNIEWKWDTSNDLSIHYDGKMRDVFDFVEEWDGIKFTLVNQ